MASMRNWCSALFVVPLCLLTTHAASAGPGAVGAVGLGTAAISPLPDGIHLSRSGRYVRDLCDHKKARFCFSHVLLPEGWTPDQPVPKRGVESDGLPGGGSNGMAPNDILNAYNIPEDSKANGKIVAILDSPDSSALADLKAYRAEFGLPALPRCAGNPTGSLPACFAQVSEDGSASSGQDGGEDADSETALDMDMISAACPDCSILLVEINNVNDSDFVAGAKTAARLGASATSISIGGPEEIQGPDPTGYTTPGHLVLAASGDFGYNLVDEEGGTPSYPASAPDILSVGGTTLFSSGNSYDEAVWNDVPFGGSFSTGQNGQDVTTSGCSTEFSMPSWQSSALSGSGCSMRATADVSAAAAFAYGGQLADIPVYQGGQWESVEGTSASSPMVAGILTRLGLTDAISNNLGWVYQHASGFNDLGSSSYPVDSQGSDTDAKNPSSCGKLCTAGNGWDGPSGVGTPNGNQLAALAGTTTTSSSDAGAGTSTTASSTSTEGETTTPGSGSGGGAVTSTAGGVETTGAASGAETTLASSGLFGASSSKAPVAPFTLTSPVGESCTVGDDCTSGFCGGLTKTALVCTQQCGAATDPACPAGFGCTGGYCFATPAAADAGAGGGDDATGGSSGGCAIAAGAGDGFDWAGAGWLSLGIAALAQRRRRGARG